MLHPTPHGLPRCSSLGDPYPVGLSHGSEPVTASPPHAFPPAAAGSQPASARHDHSPAHHGHIHHHRNHVVTGHGQPCRAELHQCSQLRLVRNLMDVSGAALPRDADCRSSWQPCAVCAAVLRPWWVAPTLCWVQALTWVESCHLEGWCPPCSLRHRPVRGSCRDLWPHCSGWNSRILFYQSSSCSIISNLQLTGKIRGLTVVLKGLLRKLNTRFLPRTFYSEK